MKLDIGHVLFIDIVGYSKPARPIRISSLCGRMAIQTSPF